MKKEMTDERILDLIYHNVENEKLINDKDFFYAVANKLEKNSIDEDVEKAIAELENGIKEMEKVINHLEMNSITYDRLVNMLWINNQGKPYQWLYDLLKKFKYKDKVFNTQGQLYVEF